MRHAELQPLCRASGCRVLCSGLACASGQQWQRLPPPPQLRQHLLASRYACAGQPAVPGRPPLATLLPHQRFVCGSEHSPHQQAAPPCHTSIQPSPLSAPALAACTRRCASGLLPHQQATCTWEAPAQRCSTGSMPSAPAASSSSGTQQQDTHPGHAARQSCPNTRPKPCSLPPTQQPVGRPMLWAVLWSVELRTQTRPAPHARVRRP